MGCFVFAEKPGKNLFGRRMERTPERRFMEKDAPV